MPSKIEVKKGNYYLRDIPSIYLSIKVTKGNNSKNDSDTVMVLMYYTS